MKKLSFLNRIWLSVKKLFFNIDKNLLNASIKITQVVKLCVNSGIPDIIASLTPTGLDDNILVLAKKNLPIILADQILLQGITDTSTEAEIQVVFQKVVDSFGKMNDNQKEKFYTSVASELLKMFQYVKSGKKLTFGQAAIFAEEAYQAWLNSK